MGLDRFGDSLGADARPVGWQEIVNPRVTRRALLGSLAASPMLLHAKAGHTAGSWYDLEFVLSDDQATLAVLEIKVTPKHDKEPETREIESQWHVPALAFGPAAFFDMAKPAEKEIDAGSEAPTRTFYVRNVEYGLRWPAGRKPGYVAFTFARPGERWTIAYLSDLWLLSSGHPEAIKSSRAALFHRFTNTSPKTQADPTGFESTRTNPFEDIVPDRATETLRAMFAGQIVVTKQSSGDLRIYFDRNLVWTVWCRSGTTLSAGDGQIRLTTLDFAWRRAVTAEAGKDGDGEKSKDKNSKDKSTEGTRVPLTQTVYFSGHTGPNEIKIAGNAKDFRIGRADGHHVAIEPMNRCAMRFDAIVGAAPTHPAKLQVVSALSLGQGAIAVGDAAGPLSDGVAGRNLVLTQTDMPADKDPVRRTAVWGHAAGMGPMVYARSPTRLAWDTTGDILSPVGTLRIREPVAEAEQLAPKSVTEAEAEEKKKAQANTKGTSSSSGGTEITLTEPKACEETDDAAGRTREQLARFFQAANGDRGGAAEATLYVLHDCPPGKVDSGRLRRIHFDMLLLGTSAALPDTSFSHLTFRHAPLRLVYEDGLPIDESESGEHPRPHSSSFVWLARGAEPRAVFDLSMATLACGRDYDLMKLRLRFHDLMLEYAPGPRIRPAREDARVWIGEDGTVHDSRPILVAEFDPQHVMEEAIFRPETPPLPDVELTEPEASDNSQADSAKGPIWTREHTLMALDAAKGETERTAIRTKVRELKIDEEAKKRAADEPKPFKEMAEAFAKDAKKLPQDQRIYIGPFALDPDGMAIARKCMAKVGPKAVDFEVEKLLLRVDELMTKGPLAESKRLLPLESLAEEEAFRNALRNEANLEALEPLYGTFRDFWRDRIAVYRALKKHGMTDKDLETKLRFVVPGNINLDRDQSLREYLTPRNRFVGYGRTADIMALVTGVRSAFVQFALGVDSVPELVGARLSGRSRLAFRIDCEAPVGVSAYEAGTQASSGAGPDRAGAGTPAFKPIPFTFEALTDWSRFEPAVTKRARKLFTALPSGLLPRPGSRAVNQGDHAMMHFQGFSQAPTTGAARMAEVQASLRSERIADVDSGKGRPFPGEPLDFETAIELPARLTLSTAQDAIWRTNRRVPTEIFTKAAPDSDAPAGLEEGEGLAGPEAFSTQPRDLWTVRLETRTQMPSLRAVSSPDLRPTALGYRSGSMRLPGEGAPPRGPYAPWFIGPEQMESGTLTAEEANPKKDPKIPEAELCAAPQGAQKYRLIRWLCERAGLRSALPVEDYAIFRTSLDAFDRHQLVLLTSTYGLPVIGKRQKVEEDDVERGGALIAESGQIEPGEAFSLLDADDNQALHKPVPLNVTALSLSALGGSFLHETAFKPSAGADDLYGRKIFEGFSIDTLQQDIVLGRDIRTEVVYKGYLLPLGHKASFVKLTERVFLRTDDNQGIKAMLRQRMYLRMADPEKLYGALGQPHFGRLWCAKRVRLLADKTPDILDPTFDLGVLNADTPESLNGRIHLRTGPGLAFWPRTDITDKGMYRFEVTLDGTPTSLPMLFIDNIAATTSASLKAAVDHYNGLLPDAHKPPIAQLIARLARDRTLHVGGGKIDYAPNSKPGEAQFETDKIHIRAHGRALAANPKSWVGNLEEKDNFVTTGVLEGGDQPPFYPAVEQATIRLGPVERLSGGEASPVDVQYDGHYVLYGFKEDRSPRGLPALTPETANPKEVFLNLRSTLTFGMGGNGDRSGGIARPESHIVAISRSLGPLGGDETTWWSLNPEQTTPPNGDVGQTDGKPPQPPFKDMMGSLASLAYYFNDRINRPKLTPAQIKQGEEQPRPAFKASQEPTPRENQWIKQAQSFFSMDAKLLGVIRLKDLMTVLDLKADSIPVLKEVHEFGTAALGDNGTLDTLGNDLRSRVLTPLAEVVAKLRAEWAALDRSLRDKQIDLTVPEPRKEPKQGEAKKSNALSLADIYPEIDGGLEKLEIALQAALAAEEPAALIPRLAAIHTAARQLIRGLAIVASNPVERLEDAVVGSLRQSIDTLTKALTQIDGLVAALEDLKKTLLDESADAAAEAVTGWIFAKIAGDVPPPDVNLEAGGRLAEILPLGLLTPELGTILKSFGETVGDEGARLAQAVLGSKAPPVKGIAPTLLEAVHNAAIKAMRPTLKTAFRALLEGKSPDDALREGLNSYSTAVKADVKAARDKATQALAEFTESADTATQRAALALQAALDRYVAGLLDDALDFATGRYPDEIQALIAGLERLALTVDSARKVAEGVAAAQPKSILEAGGILAREILGIDAVSLSATLETVTKGLLTSARTAAGQFAGPYLAVDVPLLLEEVERCAPLKRVPAKAADLPIAVDGQVKASSDLLRRIGSALDALAGLRETLAKVDTTLGDPNIPTDIAGDLRAFNGRVKVFIGEGTAQPRGITEELAALYGEVVDLQVALRDFDAALAGDTLNARTIAWIGTLAKHIRRLGATVAKRLGAIVTLVERFVRENGSFLGAGILLAGMLPYLQNRNVTLEEATRTILSDMQTRAGNMERALVAALIPIVDLGFGLIGKSIVGATDGIDALISSLLVLSTQAASLGLSLDPESTRVIAALTQVKEHLGIFGGMKVPSTPSLPATLKELLATRPMPADEAKTLADLFREPATAERAIAKAAQALRDLEGAAVRELRALQRRLAGAPEEIRQAAEVMLANSKFFKAIAESYTAIQTSRDNLLGQASKSPFLAPFARRMLLVDPAPALAGPDGSVCDLSDIEAPTATLAGCDRLAQETKVLNEAKKIGSITKPDERALLRQRIAFLLEGWSKSSAAPLIIVGQAQEMAKDLLRGNVLASIDLGAFRDQIEDAIAALIPTRVKFSYDFGSSVKSMPRPQDIFQPKKGSTFGITVRASYEILTNKSDFSASAFIGPFDIYLIGGVTDALRLRFGGAAFTMGGGSKARLDVQYEDFQIGNDLKFAQELQSYLTPKEGSGMFIQPMTRGAGIEAGYGINLGTIGVGATSFFNVSLNVSAELPFGDDEALFKVSLGRRLSPFSMGVLPFVGSGYFSIYAAADGVRGFEAAFEYGGGGAVGYGPLTAQCRIQVGVFVRILKLKTGKTTEIYGTYFAGGSASIWIFNFNTSLYVRMSSSGDGAMSGEAVYSFSFSLGIADYDYSITVTHREPAMGSQEEASLSPRGGSRTRFAAVDAPFGIDTITTGATSDTTVQTTIKARDPAKDWDTYSTYFNTGLLAGLS